MNLLTRHCIFIVATLLVSNTVMAASSKVGLAEGSTGLELIKGVVTEKQNLVPRCISIVGRECPKPMAHIALQFTLPCSEDAAVTAASTINGTKVDVQVTALRIANKSSLVARCVAANVKTAHIYVNGTSSLTKPSDVTVKFIKNFVTVD